MAKQITILQPQRMRMPVYTPWHIHFSRYLGRPLTPVEISVISPLEKARVNRNSSPVFILDPPGIDSTWILLRYQEYRLQGLPDAQGVLFIPGKDRHRYPQQSCCRLISGLSPTVVSMLSVAHPLIAHCFSMSSVTAHPPPFIPAPTGGVGSYPPSSPLIIQEVSSSSTPPQQRQRFRAAVAT